MRKLTDAEITKFASRAGVRKIAVENFLGSLGYAGSARDEVRNMRADATSYKWSAATQNAIEAGIKLAYK